MSGRRDLEESLRQFWESPEGGEALDRAQEALDRLRGAWKAKFGDDTGVSDVSAALGADAPEIDRNESVTQLASGIARSWYTRPRIKNAIALRSEDSGQSWEETKLEVARYGLFVALRRMHEPQEVRFGGGTDPGPRFREEGVRPAGGGRGPSLDPFRFIHWLHREAIREAERFVLTELPEDELVSTVAHSEPLPFDKVLLAWAEVDSIVEQANLSEEQRELVDSVLRQWSRKGAREELGLSPAAFRKRWQRLPPEIKELLDYAVPIRT